MIYLFLFLGGVNLMIYHLFLVFICWCVSFFLFVVVLRCSSSLCFPYFFVFFSVVFPLLFLGYVVFCVFLFEAKGGQTKEKGQQRKEEIKKDKKKEETGNPPKQRRNFGKGFLFCFCSAVYLKHPPPKGAKTPKRQGFRWFFLILSKNQAPYKNKSKQKNKSGGNLVIYHFGGYFFVGVFPVFVFLWFIFSFSLCFHCFSYFFLLCCFSSLISFGYFAFCVFSLWSKRRKIKKQGQQRKEKIKKEKKKEEKGNPQNKGWFLESVLLFICNILSQRCQKHWKTRFSLVLSHSLGNQAPYKQQIKTKEQIKTK